MGRRRFRRLHLFFRGFALPLMAAATVAMLWARTDAADLEGSKDHPLLKRFNGSEIVGYDTKRFADFELPTSAFRAFNHPAKKREYAKPPLMVEGALTRIWYEAAGDVGALELIRNYRSELVANKFEIIFDSHNDNIRWMDYFANYSNLQIKTNRSTRMFHAAGQANNPQVISARLSRPEGNVYVGLSAVEWATENKVLKTFRGAYIEVVVVEAKPMEQNMVTVSSADMAKAIASSGKVALYGIFFETGKSDLKPESTPALQEIAKLMKGDAALTLYVVGHTDNAGSFESNLALSEKRAASVVAALTSQYGIPASRLIPHGVANLAPIAVNTTEEGRAKNRRVELVPK
jgi:OmpA-OmpF porin, OOP family